MSWGEGKTMLRPTSQTELHLTGREESTWQENFQKQKTEALEMGDRRSLGTTEPGTEWELGLCPQGQ